jgi:hypothetical protein
MRNLELSETAHDAWSSYCAKLRHAVLNEDPSSFLRWRFVQQAMCLTNYPFLRQDLAQLKALPEWESRWRSALHGPRVGNPIPFLLDPGMNGNTIHHAAHIARWEAWAGRRVSDLDVVLEFGGGYGSMARLFRAVGFRGRYVLYDLPQFTALQRFYLDCCGLSGEFEFVSDFDTLREAVDLKGAERLFVANISLSEAPLDVREPFEELVRDWEHVLITYQSRFHLLDNTTYFARWKRPDRLWKHERIPGILDICYLFSKSAENLPRH